MHFQLQNLSDLLWHKFNNEIVVLAVTNEFETKIPICYELLYSEYTNRTTTIQNTAKHSLIGAPLPEIIGLYITTNVIKCFISVPKLSVSSLNAENAFLKAWQLRVFSSYSTMFKSLFPSLHVLPISNYHLTPFSLAFHSQRIPLWNSQCEYFIMVAEFIVIIFKFLVWQMYWFKYI